MKDGRTHLAHQAEHAVDLETGAIVAVTRHGADQGDTTTIVETVLAATEQIEAAPIAVDEPQSFDEIIADKGTTVTRRWWISRPVASGRTSPNPTAVAVPGRRPQKPRPPCMAIVAGESLWPGGVSENGSSVDPETLLMFPIVFVTA